MINAAERLSKRVRTAMGDHNNDDLPVTQCVINMRKEVVSLQAECEKLRKDAGGLLEALKACRDELRWMIERHNHQNQNDGSWLYDYQTVEEAHAALAAYRKQGGEA